MILQRASTRATDVDFCSVGFLLQVYRLPLRATVLRWEKMRGLTGLAPTCKDKLGCWVHRNRCVFISRFTLRSDDGWISSVLSLFPQAGVFRRIRLHRAARPQRNV